MPHFSLKITLLPLVTTMCLATAAVAELQAVTDDTVIFLVRHAEKVDDSKDSDLSEAGKQRSLDLARTLADAEITGIYSTDYTRTRETARPLAERLGLPVEIYDPYQLEELAGALAKSGDRVLVVGHSDTTPELVGLLGGDPISEINEAGEYDRLYIVTRDAAGQPTSLLLRYGTDSGF